MQATQEQWEMEQQRGVQPMTAVIALYLLLIPVHQFAYWGWCFKWRGRARRGGQANAAGVHDNARERRAR